MELSPLFVSVTRELLGESGFGLLLQALQKAPPDTIRFNPLKRRYDLSSQAEQSDLRSLNLIDKGLILACVPWCTEGFYLKQRPT